MLKLDHSSREAYEASLNKRTYFALGTKAFVAAVFWGLMELSKIPAPSTSPEEYLTNLGYDPADISTMPSGENISVFSKRQILTRIFRPNEKFCNPYHQRIGEQSYIELSDKGCEPLGNIETPDGKTYDLFNDHDQKVIDLFVFFHEWRHRMNALYPDVRLSETDSDIQALQALSDLGIETDSLKEDLMQWRALNAMRPFFSQYTGDYAHNSSLALYFNERSDDPSILKDYADRSFQAAIILSAYIMFLQNNSNVSINSLEDFGRAVNQALQELDPRIHSQQEMDDIKIFGQIILDAVERFSLADGHTQEMTNAPNSSLTAE